MKEYRLSKQKTAHHCTVLILTTKEAKAFINDNLSYEKSLQRIKIKDF
jgi:hypothetical protein